MTCPNCNEEIDLTNKRYFKSLLGKHECSHCLTQFKLKRTKIYFIWIFLSIIIVIGSSFFILNYVTDRKYLDISYGSLLIFLFFTCSYIDRKIENRLTTIKIK